MLINLTSAYRTNSCSAFRGYSCKRGGGDHLMLGSMTGGLGGRREASGANGEIGGWCWLL